MCGLGADPTQSLWESQKQQRLTQLPTLSRATRPHRSGPYFSSLATPRGSCFLTAMGASSEQHPMIDPGVLCPLGALWLDSDVGLFHPCTLSVKDLGIRSPGGQMLGQDRFRHMGPDLRGACKLSWQGTAVQMFPHTSPCASKGRQSLLECFPRGLLSSGNSP